MRVGAPHAQAKGHARQRADRCRQGEGSAALVSVNCRMAGRNRKSYVGKFSDVRDSIPWTLIEIKAGRRVAL